MAAARTTSRARPGQWAVERIHTHSAINPLLWLCAVVLPMALGGIYVAPYPFDHALIGLCILVVCAPVIAYFILLFRDPNRLQSETYQLEAQRIALLGDDRMRDVTTIESHPMTANPTIQPVSGESRV